MVPPTRDHQPPSSSRFQIFGASTLMACDNLLMIHGRIGTLDIYVVAAMIWALAPGNEPDTEIVGKSTWGKGETGRTKNAIAPAMAIAIVSIVQMLN